MRHAVFTIVQDEPFFFPLWHKYYSKHYPPGHIYVLYHPLTSELGGPTPAWIADHAVDGENVVKVLHDEVFNHEWLRNQVEYFAEFLLGCYDTVTFAEADEIIVLDPAVHSGVTMARWLSGWHRTNRPGARCAGYDVVHRYDREPAYDPAGPALRDRRWWYPSGLYSKTLIWRRRPHWSAGFHIAYTQDPEGGDRFETYGPEPEPGLILAHLHRFDYGVAAARLARTSARFTGRHRGGYQNRLEDEDQLKEWWYTNIDKSPLGNTPYQAAELVEIPESIRAIDI